jgi:CheY-like chemotaxis protein
MKITRVLILEDDAFQRRFLQLYLEAAGFEVEYGENGRDGIKILKESESFDLIMSDLKMPVMNGMEFLIEIKKHENLSDIPVVLLSKIDNQKIKEKAESLGAYHFMEKPFTNEKISDLLKTLQQVNQ